MNRYFKGALIGGLVGATAALAATTYNPRMTRQWLRKGKSLVRQCQRKMKDMEIF